MTLDIDAIEPRRCPICDAGVLSKWDSPTGLSHFIRFACDFEMRDQYEARPRGWKPNLGSTCRNIDAQSLWSLRRAVDQSAEDFNAEAVARLKAEAEVSELRAALDRARALANELQNYAKDKEGEMSVTMAAVVGTMRGIGDRLAALLSAASGGAA